MPGNRFDMSRLGVGPEGMLCPLSFQVTSVSSQVSQQRAPLHCPTTTWCRTAPSGVPRKASCLRSSKMRAMDSDRLFRHSSSVLPWPFAPGISGQYAMNQSPSLSTIAVNSFLIEVFPLSACALMLSVSLSSFLNPFLAILPGRVSSVLRSVE